MDWLNYHHLLYFWMVAREGSLVAAAKVLRLSHPTLSAQVRALEDRLGERLFSRSGRRLELTEAGRVAFRFADEIFSLGREMVDTVQGRAAAKTLRLDVGVSDVVPKSLVRRLLQPALGLPGGVHLVCREDAFDRLLADLAIHAIDVVIADGPVPSGSKVKAHHQLLAETGVGLFGTRDVVARHRRGFPGSLDGAPVLLPIESMALRRSLDHWFSGRRVRPRVVAEFEDSALLEVFGRDGFGVFPAPLALADELRRDAGIALLGRVDGVKERFYAISTERRESHPAVLAILSASRGGAADRRPRVKARPPGRLPTRP